MDFDGFLKLREPLLHGKFAQDPVGRSAINQFTNIYTKWEADYLGDAEKRGELDAVVRRIVQDDPVRYVDKPPAGPIIVNFGPRKRRAVNTSEVKRMLAVSASAIKRFHFKVERVLDTGEIRPFTASGSYEAYFDALERERENRRYEDQLAQAALASARDAQKRFKSERIPMNFIVSDAMVFYNLSGDYVNEVEKPFVHQTITASCERHGLHFFPQPDVANLQYGSIHLFWSEKRFNERFPLHYY